jgi:hypothetical protein
MRAKEELEMADEHEWRDVPRNDLELLARTTIVTSSSKGFEREKGVPVRTTVGAPRFWRSDTQGELAFLPEIAPYVVFKNPALVEGLNHDYARRAKVMKYEQRLEDGAAGIVTGLARIAPTTRPAGVPGRHRSTSPTAEATEELPATRRRVARQVEQRPRSARDAADPIPDELDGDDQAQDGHDHGVVGCHPVLQPGQHLL